MVKCLQCGRLVPAEKTERRNITRRAWSERRQRAYVQTVEMGPFCSIEFKRVGEPACGAAYQMGCEG